MPTAASACGSQTHSSESVRAHETMQWRGSQCWEVTNSSGVGEQLSRREGEGGPHEIDSVSWYQGSAWPGWTNKPVCVVLRRNPAVQEVSWRKCKQTWVLCDKAAINWIQVAPPLAERDFGSSTACLGVCFTFYLKRSAHIALISSFHFDNIWIYGPATMSLTTFIEPSGGVTCLLTVGQSPAEPTCSPLTLFRPPVQRHSGRRRHTHEGGRDNNISPSNTPWGMGGWGNEGEKETWLVRDTAGQRRCAGSSLGEAHIKTAKLWHSHRASGLNVCCLAQIKSLHYILNKCHCSVSPQTDL